MDLGMYLWVALFLVNGALGAIIWSRLDDRSNTNYKWYLQLQDNYGRIRGNLIQIAVLELWPVTMLWWFSKKKG